MASSNVSYLALLVLATVVASSSAYNYNRPSNLGYRPQQYNQFPAGFGGNTASSTNNANTVSGMSPTGQLFVNANANAQAQAQSLGTGGFALGLSNSNAGGSASYGRK